MRNKHLTAAAATPALGFAAMFLAIAPALGEPAACPTGAVVAGSACSATLTSVTSKDFTITGTPVGGQSPITLSGQSDAYLKSTGFTNTPPDAIQQWDATIDRVNGLPAPTNPPDPNWYGEGKSRAFMPVELNRLATEFPPQTIVVRFAPDASHPDWSQLLSIQPTG